MNKIARKVTATVALVAMLSGALAGCGGKKTEHKYKYVNNSDYYILLKGEYDSSSGSGSCKGIYVEDLGIGISGTFSYNSSEVTIKSAVYGTFKYGKSDLSVNILDKSLKFCGRKYKR